MIATKMTFIVFFFKGILPSKEYKFRSHSESKIFNLITVNVLINKITAQMYWFFLRCVHINREFAFMTLPKNMEKLL